MLHDNARFASWRQEAAWCAKQTGIWFDGPVTLSVIWVRPRPKSHYRTGKHAANLRLDVPLAPGTKPDLCKVVRALEDSLTGTLWRDDSQVVQHQTAKIYSWHGAEECLRVRVRDWCINDLSSIDMGDEL